MLGRSLSRLSASAKSLDTAGVVGLAMEGKIDAQGERVKAALTHVQNSVSMMQTADGFMGGMAKALTRMGELVNLGKEATANPEDAAIDAREFRGLQEQLRRIIGGATEEIGGSEAVPAPQAVFNGRPLFGLNDAGRLGAQGASLDQETGEPAANLRTGGMLETFRQDSAGVFTLTVSDADALQKISNGRQHLESARASLGAARSQLELSSATLQVEHANLTSATARITDVGAADEATQFAKFNILLQSETALRAQANQTAQSVLKLLQG
jgi:flagellin